MSILDKIRSVEALGAIVAETRAAGRKVVQAHGTFDLLHLGHIRHLQAAREFGDVLVVTVTADEYVNKGPGRPVFGEGLRAEMLAALQIVDWVAINPSPDAVSAIRTIQPDVYVKGQDYQNPEGDVTGKIVSEREAVEAGGGQLCFTDEITFSSSELINRHMHIFEPHVHAHLSGLREGGGLEAILELIERVRDYRVLVVGDAIVDEYHYVRAMNKPPKEHIIATRYQDFEMFAGGAFASANHVAGLCAQVDVISVLGERESHENFIRGHLKDNVTLEAVYRPEAPTTRKRRYVDPSYMHKLFEVYYMDDDPLPDALVDELDEMIRARAGDYDLVIVNDFGHSMIGASTIAALIETAPFLAVNAQSNSANLGFNLIDRYRRADYVCIDHAEARLATRNRESSIGDIVANEMPTLVDCERMIITHGKHGCVTYERGQPTHTLPAIAGNIVDTVGAGDAFLAVTSPLVRAGGAMHHVGFIGNVVGALKVAIVGHRKSIEKVDIVKSITGLLK